MSSLAIRGGVYLPHCLYWYAVTTTFNKLNKDWNAEPNVPFPEVSVDGSEVVLEFEANSSLYPQFEERQKLRLRFFDVYRYRLGLTNDEGWARGQCRFSGIAPEWGEFYEVSGDLKFGKCPDDWVVVSDVVGGNQRHFLFYLRDETFECTASDWLLEK